MDKIANALPVNKTAAMVTGGGFIYKPDKIKNRADQMAPIPLRKGKIKDPCFTDLTGTRFGRFTVTGLASEEYGGGKWAVRCDCGVYTIRKTKSVKNEFNQDDRCSECCHLEYLKDKDYYHRTGKDRPDRMNQKGEMP